MSALPPVPEWSGVQERSPHAPPLASRRKTRTVRVGAIEIGGDSPVSVQSMTTTKTDDWAATIEQIDQLAAAGCEIVRVSVPDPKAAAACKKIKEGSRVPLVADIHFDHRFALAAIDAGWDKLRLNPGNIRDPQKVREVVRAAKDRGMPIRIGVNMGSLAPDIVQTLGRTPAGMVESALRHIRILEELEFGDIVVSLKAHDVRSTVAAYRIMASKVDYPFHLGITEAGTLRTGTVKSSVGLGMLLAEGIGDTIRVSLAADPVEEVPVCWEILKSLGIRERGVEITACPSCGRVQVDILKLADAVEKVSAEYRAPVKIAVMGCAVNGPGEASMADVGIAGGKGMGLIYRDGVKVRSLPESQLLDGLREEIERVIEERYPEYR
ncbi:MAG TPA: flavodoxin-dependent (E)-4-hydroxy-3-methylbut-2-enyl-diphosphate synthase [Candidatus Eremiobacteraceae bacterium]|nr:flavodoxin-dependent (E)-4-hydroxy-3-methylbut-2-enyl-diphosphate synthase [Candidatus Eremiobacteraceae bacterium]